MTLFTLSYEAAVAGARKAYEEGRLGFQQPIEISDGKCLYVYPKKPECGCAIGVNLPDELRTVLRDNVGQNREGISSLAQHSREVLNIRDGDFDKLSELQAHHDRVVSFVGGSDKTAFNRHREAFEKLIGFGEYAPILGVDVASGEHASEV